MCTTDVYFGNYFTFFSSTKEYAKTVFSLSVCEKERRNLCFKIYDTTRKTAGLGNEIKERM
jgi:hypothetical protein